MSKNGVRKKGALPQPLSGYFSTYVPLDRATYVELFFDLVFIFCMRSILPIITDVEGGHVDWYTYYTFTFTFVLMIQIWFNSTIFMNRFGRGGVGDIIFLFTNMFLLFVMTQAISTSWENFAIYNISWVIITINTIVHWILRYKAIENPSEQIQQDTRMAVVTLASQAALVLISHPMPHNPAQVVCLLALLSGFVFWYAGGRDQLSAENREHLSERCALLMVLTFGETLIGFGNVVGTDLHLFTPAMYFLLIIGMFLIYLNEIVNLLDLESLRGGRRYMALSAWLTLCVANVTAGFEMSLKNMQLMFMSGDMFFGVSIVVFLMSFLLFMPFNIHKRRSAKWIGARTIACFVVMVQTSAVVIAASRVLTFVGLEGVTTDAVLLQFSHVMMAIAVGAVYLVLYIDRRVVRRDRKMQAAQELAKAQAAQAEAEAQAADENADSPRPASTPEDSQQASMPEDEPDTHSLTHGQVRHF